MAEPDEAQRLREWLEDMAQDDPELAAFSTIVVDIITIMHRLAPDQVQAVVDRRQARIDELESEQTTEQSALQLRVARMGLEVFAEALRRRRPN